jgi:hypothetical protein
MSEQAALELTFYREPVSTNSRILSMRQTTAYMLACVLTACTAFADDSQSSAASGTDDRPDATVDLNGGSFALGVGYVWGKGDLNYQGTKHKFKLSGVSVVDVGGAHITASGDVYHLSKLQDFNGNYTAATAGLTVAGGGSVAVLRNEHGVVIKLHSTTEGLRFNLSADGIGIKLGN